MRLRLWRRRRRPATIFRSKPDPARSPSHKAIARWYSHVERVGEELANATARPSWSTRLWRGLGEYFGFSIRGEVRGFVRWLLDFDPPTRWVHVELPVLELAASEAAIVATALRMTPPERWSPEVRLRLAARLDKIREQLEGRLPQEVGERAVEPREAVADV